MQRDYSQEEGSDWSVTKAENGLGLGDYIDPDVELKREIYFIVDLSFDYFYIYSVYILKQVFLCFKSYFNNFHYF